MSTKSFDAINAAETIKREVKRLENLAIVGTLLQEYGSFDNALTEVKRMHKDALESFEQLKVEVKTLIEQREAIKLETEKLIDDANEHINKIKLNREKDEEAIRIELEDYRAGLVREIRNEVERSKPKFMEELNVLRDEKQVLLDSINKLARRNKKLELEHKTLEDKLLTVKSEMNKFAEFFGK